MFKLAMLSLVPALMLVGGVEAQAQVNVTGGYVCQGNCVAPGRCARAYADTLWMGRNHISFYNEAGSYSDGGYATPTKVTAATWGLLGQVYPGRIVWYRVGSPRVYAQWIRSPACWY